MKNELRLRLVNCYYIYRFPTPCFLVDMSDIVGPWLMYDCNSQKVNFNFNIMTRLYVSERPCNEITYVKRCIHLGIRLNIRIEEFQGNESLEMSMMRYNDERRQSAQADLAKITSMWAFGTKQRFYH